MRPSACWRMQGALGPRNTQHRAAFSLSQLHQPRSSSRTRQTVRIRRYVLRLSHCISRLARFQNPLALHIHNNSREAALHSRAGIPRVRIKKGKANLFLEGNPIVYAGAVDAVSGSPASGAAVIVADWKDCAIAWGESCCRRDSSVSVCSAPAIACDVILSQLRHRVSPMGFPTVLAFASLVWRLRMP